MLVVSAEWYHPGIRSSFARVSFLRCRHALEYVVLGAIMTFFCTRFEARIEEAQWVVITNISWRFFVCRLGCLSKGQAPTARMDVAKQLPIGKFALCASVCSTRVIGAKLVPLGFTWISTSSIVLIDIATGMLVAKGHIWGGSKILAIPEATPRAWLLI